MTTGDRYQQYYMEADSKQVYFYRTRIQDRGTIEHDIARMHITSIDSPEKKVLCKSRRHFGFTISNEKGHRKLYTLSYQHLLQGIDYLLRA